MPYGYIPGGVRVIEKLHGSEFGWYEIPFDDTTVCSCCDKLASPEHEGLASDEDGPCHFCHDCVEGL